MKATKQVKVETNKPKVDLQKKNEMFYAYYPECERLAGTKIFHNKKLMFLDFFEEFWTMFADAHTLAEEAVKYIKTKRS